jgi:alpha-1,2-mannosyltransferase
LALTLCGLLGPVVSPYSWNHHWVWLIPLALFVAHRLTTGQDRYWLAPLLLLPLTLPWIADLANPPVGPPALAGGPVALVLDNTYLLIFVLTLACATRYLRPTPAG